MGKIKTKVKNFFGWVGVWLLVIVMTVVILLAIASDLGFRWSL